MKRDAKSAPQDLMSGAGSIPWRLLTDPDDDEPVAATFVVHHTPVRPLTKEEIDRDFAGGEWRKTPWFLGEQPNDEFERRGFRPEDLVEAADALAQVYDAHVCRRLLTKPPRFSQLVYGLFRRVPWWERLIGLGLDLARCRYGLREGLAKRLAHPEQFDGADLELQIQANALRAEIDIGLAPGEGTGPRTDFHASFRTLRIQLEVKGHSNFQGELAMAGVEERFNSMIGARLAPPNDRHWHIAVTGPFRKLPFDKKGRADLDGREPEYGEAIHAALERVRRGGWVPGAYEVREDVSLLVATALDGEGGRWSFDLFDEVEPAYKVKKAADVLDDALEQFDFFGAVLPGVFLLDLPWETDPRPVGAEMNKRISADPIRYRYIDGVILRMAGRQRQAEPLWEWHTWYWGAWAIPGSRLGSPVVQALGEQLVNSPHRLMFGWLRPKNGQPPPPLRSKRVL